MIRTTVEDAQVRLKELIDAALRGEDVVILTGTQDTEASVRIVSVGNGETRPKLRQAGSAKGLFTLTDDFDQPLEDFKDHQ